MSVAAIIAASGSGLRLGGDKPKQYQSLGDKPVLAHTLGVFDQLDIINEIYIAAPAAYVTHTWEIAKSNGFSKVKAVVSGGANRAQSIYKALKEIPEHTGIVLIHDGVRPFVSGELIKAVAKAARIHGAAVAGTPLTDTIKEVDEKGQVLSTPDRKRLWRIQTPQGFTYELIAKAYAQGKKDKILDQATDDSMLVERLGTPVHIVEGHPSNIKLTTQEDLLLGELMLPSQRKALPEVSKPKARREI